MGVYLGSNNLLGGGSGGGSRFYTDVYEMPKITAGENTIMVPYGTSPQYSNAYNFNVMITGHAGTPGANFPRYYGNVVSDDTYLTLCDITNSTNGGVFWNLLGPGTGAANTVLTVKITKDGEDPVEQAFTVESGGHRLLMGFNYFGFMGSQSTTTTTARAQPFFNNYYSQYRYAPGTQELAAKTQSLANGTGNYFTIPSLQETLVNGTGLRFNESLKLEIKTSSVSTSSYRDAVAALVTEF